MGLGYPGRGGHSVSGASPAAGYHPALQTKTPSSPMGRRRRRFAVPPIFRALPPGNSADHHHGRGSANGEPLRPGLLGSRRSAGDSRGMFGRSSVSDLHHAQTRWTARLRRTRLDHRLYYSTWHNYAGNRPICQRRQGAGKGRPSPVGVPSYTSGRRGPVAHHAYRTRHPLAKRQPDSEHRRSRRG